MFSRLVYKTFKGIHSVSGKGTTGCVNLRPHVVPCKHHSRKDTVRQLNVMSPKMVQLEHSEYLIAQLA